MLIIKESDIHKLITLNEVIEINEQVFKKESNNQVVCPNRTIIPINNNNIYFKPSLINNESVGIKIVGTFADNAKKNLPTVPGTIILNDVNTGIVNAIIGATYITGLRTAAGSALSVKYLSPDSPNSLFVFGSGLQAKLHIEMILLLKPTIKNVFISSRTKSNIEKMINELLQDNQVYKDNKIEFSIIENNDNINENSNLKNADIVVCASSSTEPLFNGEEIFKNKNKSVLICAVGSSRPSNRELDSFTICNSNLIIDDLNSCMVSGELSIPIEKEASITKSHILAKLCDVVTGNFKLSNDSKPITVYKSAGTAIQDIATAHYVYKKALKNNVGINIDMTS